MRSGLSSEPSRGKAQETVCKRWWIQWNKVGWRQEEYANIMKGMMTGKVFPSCLVSNVVGWPQVFGSTGREAWRLTGIWTLDPWWVHLSSYPSSSTPLPFSQFSIHPSKAIKSLQLPWFPCHAVSCSSLAWCFSCKISGVRGSCSDQCNAGKGVAVHNLRLLEDATS